MEPADLDRVASEAWGAVYQGNAGDNEGIARSVGAQAARWLVALLSGVEAGLAWPSVPTHAKGRLPQQVGHPHPPTPLATGSAW